MKGENYEYVKYEYVKYSVYRCCGCRHNCGGDY
jgi:hypothetical protein